MKMLNIKNVGIGFVLVAILSACNFTNAQKEKSDENLEFSQAKPASYWKKKLSADAYEIMVNKGTERPYSNAYFDNHKNGIYVSAATGEPLFSSDDKFDSGTGWPSFSKPINETSVLWVQDNSHGMSRDEVVEKATGLHLGHVFNDGPTPTGLRYCINSASLVFVEGSTTALEKETKELSKAYFASGCFWCVEAVYESVKGVDEVISGYSGGHTKNPTYEESNTGKTGHAEAVEVIYDSTKITFAQLVDVYFGSQDPFQVNGQGPDKGSQYRSIIFYQNEEEQKIINQKITTLEVKGKVAAEVKPFEVFWLAEDYHQDYEKLHPNNGYIQAVSLPRLHKFQEKFPELLKGNGH